MSAAPTTLTETANTVMFWKAGTVLCRCAVKVVKAVWSKDVLWPDELDFSDVAESDKNCIGIAFRLLMQQGIIERTGNYRRSESGPSKGRTIFSYRITSASKARTFLERYGHEKAEEPQMSLAI